MSSFLLNKIVISQLPTLHKTPLPPMYLLSSLQYPPENRTFTWSRVTTSVTMITYSLKRKKDDKQHLHKLLWLFKCDSLNSQADFLFFGTRVSEPCHSQRNCHIGSTFLHSSPLFNTLQPFSLLIIRRMLFLYSLFLFFLFSLKTWLSFSLGRMKKYMPPTSNP